MRRFPRKIIDWMVCWAAGWAGCRGCGGSRKYQEPSAVQEPPGAFQVGVSAGEPPAASARAVPAPAGRKRARWRARADSDSQAASGEGCAGFFWVEDELSGEEGGFWFAGGFWARSAKPELKSKAASASPTRLFHGLLVCSTRGETSLQETVFPLVDWAQRIRCRELVGSWPEDSRH